MFFHKNTDADGPPCKFMETFLNEAASGNAKGLWRWYAFAHAARCLRCAKFLRGLQETIARLNQSHDQDLPSDVMERLSQKMSHASEAAAESM